MLEDVFEKFRAFIASLSTEEAHELALWIDGAEAAPDWMIEEIYDEHPPLDERDVG